MATSGSFRCGFGSEPSSFLAGASDIFPLTQIGLPVLDEPTFTPAAKSWPAISLGHKWRVMHRFIHRAESAVGGDTICKGGDGQVSAAATAASQSVSSAGCSITITTMRTTRMTAGSPSLRPGTLAATAKSSWRQPCGRRAGENPSCNRVSTALVSSQ